MHHIALIVVASSVIAGCDGREPPDPRARFPVPVAGAALEDEKAELPRIAFPDGSKTENDRCIVRQRRLDPGLPPVWVNGRPIGFC